MLDAQGAEVDRDSFWISGSDEVRTLSISVDGNVAHTSDEGDLLVFDPSSKLVLMHQIIARGLHADAQGRICVAGEDEVGAIQPSNSYETLLSGGPAVDAAGVVYDQTRGLLFFTNANRGWIRRVEVAEDGSLGSPLDVVVIPDADLVSMAMDTCGSLYVADLAAQNIIRVAVDADGSAYEGSAEAILATDAVVGLFAFGSGDGFDPMALYFMERAPGGFTHAPRRVWVGVPGAPVPRRD